MAVQKRRVTTATTPGHIPPPDEIPASGRCQHRISENQPRRFRFAPIYAVLGLDGGACKLPFVHLSRDLHPRRSEALAECPTFVDFGPSA